MDNKLEMPKFITDDVIELHARVNHDYDADLWHEIDECRNYLRQYLTWVDKNHSIDDCISATDMFINEWNAGKIHAYSIVLKSTKKAIGSIDIHNINDNNQAEIGYWLSQNYTGRGLMSRAVKLIEKQSFEQGIHRLVISVQKNNTSSSRVAERNNYVLEGIMREALYKYGQYYDTKIYAKINNS